MGRDVFKGEVGGGVGDTVGGVDMEGEVMTIIAGVRMAEITTEVGMPPSRKNRDRRALSCGWTICKRCRSKSCWIRQVKWEWKIPEGC